MINIHFFLTQSKFITASPILNSAWSVLNDEEKVGLRGAAADVFASCLWFNLIRADSPHTIKPQKQMLSGPNNAGTVDCYLINANG